MPTDRVKKRSGPNAAGGTPMDVDSTPGGVGPGQGFGLEEIGIPGRDFLRDALTNCSDPLKAIDEFQVLTLNL